VISGVGIAIGVAVGVVAVGVVAVGAVGAEAEVLSKLASVSLVSTWKSMLGKKPSSPNSPPGASRLGAISSSPSSAGSFCRAVSIGSVDLSGKGQRIEGPH
jgi:hypothetical protein